MKIIIILLLTVSIYANQQIKFTTTQQTIMIKIFNKARQFDLQYTMTAIAWQESQFGKYRINLNDPSCGIFHIMPKFLINKVDMINNSWNRSRLCERLIVDDDFSFSAALLELKYWQNYWKTKHVNKVWSHMIASYNQGFNCNTNSTYVKNIKQKIRYLKRILHD